MPLTAVQPGHVSSSQSPGLLQGKLKLRTLPRLGRTAVFVWHLLGRVLMVLSRPSWSDSKMVRKIWGSGYLEKLLI